MPVMRLFVENTGKASGTQPEFSAVAEHDSVAKKVGLQHDGLGAIGTNRDKRDRLIEEF